MIVLNDIVIKKQHVWFAKANWREAAILSRFQCKRRRKTVLRKKSYCCSLHMVVNSFLPSTSIPFAMLLCSSSHEKQRIFSWPYWLWAGHVTCLDNVMVAIIPGSKAWNVFVQMAYLLVHLTFPLRIPAFRSLLVQRERKKCGKDLDLTYSLKQTPTNPA